MNLVKNPSQALAPISQDALQQLVDQVLGKPISNLGQYRAEITRKAPTAFLFLVDQSGSMAETMRDAQGKESSKAEMVATVVNHALEETLNRCTKDYGLGEYIEVAALGYGGEEDQIRPPWKHPALENKEWLALQTLSDAAENGEEIIRVTQRDGAIVEKKVACKRWLEAYADGRTPMRHALDLATKMLAEWILRHPDSFPPAVINITDGAATDIQNDTELLDAAKRLRSMRTSDGEILLFNCHISNAGGKSVLFPSTRYELPEDEFARLLYDMSSQMPQSYIQVFAQELRIEAMSSHVAMVYNADANNLLKILNIGTTPSSRVG